MLSLARYSSGNQTKDQNMAKIYSDHLDRMSKMQPKKETIRFLLDYSKALSVINCKRFKFNIVLN